MNLPRASKKKVKSLKTNKTNSGIILRKKMVKNCLTQMKYFQGCCQVYENGKRHICICTAILNQEIIERYESFSNASNSRINHIYWALTLLDTLLIAFPWFTLFNPHNRSMQLVSRCRWENLWLPSAYLLEYSVNAPRYFHFK